MKLNKLFLISLVCISQTKAMNFDTIKSKYNQLSSRQKKMLGAAIVSLASVYAIYKYMQKEENIYIQGNIPLLEDSKYGFLITHYKGIAKKLASLKITKKDINEGAMFFNESDYKDVAIKLKNKSQYVAIFTHWDGSGEGKWKYEVSIEEGENIDFPQLKLM